jgi:hypothetical protein
MPAARSPRRPLLSLEGLESRSLPSTTPLLIEPFETPAAGGLPAGWSQWSSTRAAAFGIDKSGGLGDLGELASTAPTGVAARAWVTAPFQADVETTAAVYVNSLVPVQLFIRGKNLNTAAPTYYAVSITRGTQVELQRVVGGRATVIGAARSGDWISNKWIQVTLRAEGNVLKVQLRRSDTGRYLDTSGNWAGEPVNAIFVRDSAIATAGQVGFNRGTGGPDRLVVDSLRVSRAYPDTRSIYQVERFDGETNGSLPDGWVRWSSLPSGIARTSPDQLLQVSNVSGGANRVWLNRSEPADIQVSSSLYVDSLIPAQLFARGQGLDTTKPTFYAVSVTRGLDVQLVRVVNGRQTVLGDVKSKTWISGQWLQVSLVAKGNELRAQVFRTDTGQYLNSDGSWGLAPNWALIRTDAANPRGGYTGVGRGAGTTGTLSFDNFVITSAPVRWDEMNPIPTRDDKTTPIPTPPDGSTNPPPLPPPTNPPPAPGPVPGTTGLPAVPRNIPWIRVAQLAYYGTPLTDFEKSLIQNKVDLVIPNLTYLDAIARLSPDTPQFVYTNVSNVYLGMLTDWLEYADRNHLSREAAFYHVTRPTPTAGASASSVPVNRFWGVYRGSGTTGLTDLTSAARNADTSVAFGALGQSLSVGYTEKFREINVALRAAAANNWASHLEYVTAVDSLGRPTAWAPLRLIADGTAGLHRSGQLTFDPPANWVAASINGSARLFYVRFRTTHAGTAPVALSILGRDYTNSRGANSGIIPAFDHAADANRDGYLSDAEYARRRPGFDARFAYESRLFYPNYGPNRFATNVSNPSFRAWAADYHARLAASQPKAAGFFVDNSVGKIAANPAFIAEPLGNYAADYGSLLGAINARLAPMHRWLIANTSGASGAADPIIRNRVSYLEEFSLRPLSANYVQFEDLAATLAYRRQLSGGKAYEILDSLPTGGIDANNPRMQLATLAMYYLLADPNLSFLMMNGGNEPASSWTRHWTNAINFDVGRPTATWTVFGTGQDPSNRGLDFKVYSRAYQHALVVYKPLSYTRGVSGATGDNTATTFALGGRYRAVHADGTLGPVVTSVTLRNGEGAILARV